MATEEEYSDITDEELAAIYQQAYEGDIATDEEIDAMIEEFNADN